MNCDDDRLSPYLDHELDPACRAEVEAALALDPELAAELAAIAGVRRLLRTDGLVDLRAGSLERIVAFVRDEELGADAAVNLTAVRSLPDHRRVRVLAAVAASLVIVVGVVGGLVGGIGGGTTLPAVGNFVASHEAVAAGPEPAVVDDRAPLDDMPIMGHEMEMMHTSITDDVVHVLYEGPSGSHLSIFRIDGELDLDGLVDEIDTGEMSKMDGHARWSAAMGQTQVVVLDGDGYVWTIVSDSAYDGLADMMANLPTRRQSLTDRARHLVEAVVEPFQLGVS